MIGAWSRCGKGEAAFSGIGAPYERVKRREARPLPEIQVPVQIIAGAHDTVVPPVNAEFLHRRLPHSQLDIIADTGHFAWEDAAEEYAALVTGWWAQLGRTNGTRAAV
jgi:pimeloyl-ACP methyl ester carboxylesterase